MDASTSASSELDHVKVENSPVESLLALPSAEVFTPLFDSEAMQSPGTPNTPYSRDDTSQHTRMGVSSTPDVDLLASLGVPTVTDPTPVTQSEEKKPAKKRKSWGQVLPEPKTNLPPRKRAKTEDEKEQRRVERVLRNRRAAQSSRERKRQETEKLEHRNRALESALSSLQRTNQFLLQAVKELKEGREVTGTATLDNLLQNPTLSRSIFEGQSQSSAPPPPSSAFDFAPSTMAGPEATVDPSRLSPPALAAIQEDEEPVTLEPSPDFVAAPAETPADLAQHPAEVLCGPQCQSTEKFPRALTASLQEQSPEWMVLLTSVTLTAISILRNPCLWVACSLKAGLSLPPNRQITTAIIWMVTRESSKPTLTLTDSSASPRKRRILPQPSRPRSGPLPTGQAPPSRSRGASTSRTLRSKCLKKILTCSPGLARPLADATLEVLRLVSLEAQGNQGSGHDAHEQSGREASGRVLPEGWIQDAPLPSREVLVTLLWAIQVEERRQRLHFSSKPGSLGTSPPTATRPRYDLQSLLKTRRPENEGVRRLSS